MEIILQVLGGIALPVFSTILRGYVLTWLWLWFVVPVFNAPHLGIAQAVGISALAQFLILNFSAVDESELKKKSFSMLSVEAISISLVAWGLGYLLTFFL